MQDLGFYKNLEDAFIYCNISELLSYFIIAVALTLGLLNQKRWLYIILD